MTKKALVLICTAVILCLCCSVSFAVENNNSITLGNEVMQSIDKTGDSLNNLVSGNMMTETTNSVVNGAEDVKDGIDNMGNDMMRNNQDYNVTQTTTEGNIGGMGMNTMTTTTWMWIILAVAAIIIIAAIWYYATQNND